MTVLPIVTWPDPRLTAVCAPVAGGEDVSELAADMLATMYAAPGRGLAAPQVGVLKRLLVMDATWKSGPPAPLVMVNPVLVAHCTNRATAEERCLSIPDHPVVVERPAALTVRWTALDGTAQQRDFEGVEALIVQHEMDHLDGILILHHAGELVR
ncbi:MAG: peptide deformylase [Rhodobacteraceae bacterium]|jgi:peptide deformylase|nr:peptide deformylase [Paracoccaceae bacterium]